MTLRRTCRPISALLSRTFLPTLVYLLCFQVVSALAADPPLAPPSRPSVFSTDVAPVFEHLTVDDGLPENSVRAIIQDRTGFLWFGTQNGLVRFDGYDMKVFLPSPGDSDAFGGRTVLSLFEDTDGDLWIGTFLNGLWRFDTKTETFTAYPLTHSEGLGSGNVQDVCEDSEGNIWAALKLGLARLDRRTGEITWWHDDFPEAPGGAEAAFKAVMEDDGGGIWAGTEGTGVAIFERGTQSPSFYQHDPADSTSLVSSSVHDIFQASDGSVWVATEEGLSLWQSEAKRFTSYQPQPGAGAVGENRLIRIAEDEHGLLWIGSVAGVYAFNPASERFRLFAHHPQRPFSPANGPVLSIYCDRSGIVWAGSWYAGLNKMDPSGIGFRILRSDPANPGSLDYNSVQAVHEDSEGGLWVATARDVREGVLGALNRRAKPGDPFERISLDPEAEIPYGTARCLHEDPDGDFWVGTSRGLWKAANEHLTQVKGDGGAAYGELAKSNVGALATDPQGFLWIGSTNNGLFRLRKSTGQLVQFRHDPSDPTSLSQNAVIVVHVDPSGRVWAGTDAGGLNLYLPDTGSFRRFFDPELGLDSIIDICSAANEDLWLGTFAGLLRFNAQAGVIASYGLLQGLPNDQVVSILRGDEGCLWLSTGKGFARFDPTDESIVTFEQRDGLPTNEAHFAHHRGRDGTMYFGGPGGLVTFHPGEFRDNPYVPPVVLTGITVYDAPLTVGGDSPLRLPIHLAHEIELRYDQNDISLSFASLDFGRPERNQYRFQLQNYDDDWREPGWSRTATYTNLGSGNYVFHVQGTNRDGIWNEEGATLRITILPPWWRTQWAYGVYVLLGVLLVYAVYRQIVSRERMNAALAVERAEAKQYQELDRLKTRFLTNISHEFRTPLTLIKAPLQRLLKDKGTVDAQLMEMMARNAGRLGQLIDQLLDLSRLEAGRLPVKWQRGDYTGFLRALVSSFDSLAETRGINLETQFPQGSSEAWYDPDLLEKVVGNLLSNALKFTPDGGEVNVDVKVHSQIVLVPVPRSTRPEDEGLSLEAREITIAVANTGSFIPPRERKRVFDRFHYSGSAGGSGIGLALVKELTEWMGGRIVVDSDRARGTKFKVTLPIFLAPPVADADIDETGEPAELVNPLPGSSAEEVELATASATDEEDQPPLVLVVEDHPDLLDYLRNELPPEFRVVEATRGDEGLDKAIAEIPDLVLSDVMMPGLDGFELCGRLKDDERTSHIPVILLTALTETESKRRGLETGADDYLPKPFDTEELKIRIRNLIVQRRKLAEQFARQVATLAPEAMPVSSADERFLLRSREIIEAHLDDPDFRIDTFCREIAMSRSQLHRKLKAVTGKSTREIIRAHRLQRAAQLLEAGYGNVTEVAFAVGFRHLSYFSSSFHEQYGVMPSDFPQKR